jgi:membrane protein YdbS with pleckstrin-like domain
VEPAPATGPIPAVGDDVRELSDDAGPRESALAWLRFAGELVIAAAVGVGIYFLFTVLWQTLPHVAVVVAPLAVTGLVAGVGMWRRRFGHAQLGPRLLAVLVFAGTLLTVLPAAGLVSGG